jgi:flagellar biosynthesis protein FlhA
MMGMFKSGKSELILVLAVVGILMLLFTPIPPGFLDFLLLTNFSLAMIILLLTF